jgi:hypothetical protein
LISSSRVESCASLVAIEGFIGRGAYSGRGIW